MTYEISKLAAIDLENIYVYTSTQFGMKQAESYHSELTKHFELLTTTPLLGKDTSAIANGYRRSSHKSHNIYYKLLQNHVFIVRILHNKQDPIKHI
jgi:toxin ParE1/3/4